MIEKIFKDTIYKIINEINKDENKWIIKKDIINPLLNELKLYFYPYIILLLIYFFILLFINLLLIILIFKKL